MKKIAISFLSMLTFLAVPNLLAQSTTGTITGIVKDPSGASISGAKVSVRNLATNETVTTQTTDAGSYTAPSLLPDLTRHQSRRRASEGIATSITR